mmetsp:Transcript_105752/g.207388  ORF Transcript_105752/g.207388 Transcript_105752/m.207388 type:complete len:210 (-) Transcript_105752:88-717(-)
MADAKPAEDKKKAEKKLLDQDDEAFCGYCSVHILDQDGIAGRTLGSSVKAPVSIVSAPGADTVVFEAGFNPGDPLFYLELRNEEQFYLWGQWWMDGPKQSETNAFCSLVPLKTQDCHKQLESTPGEFKAQLHCPYLRNSTSRLMDATFQTQEKKFKTKLCKATFSMPRDAWMEYKAYRVRLWKSGKIWQGMAKGDDDEEKKEEGGKKDD